MRFGLDLYANIRPVQAARRRLCRSRTSGAKDVDFVVFRENTEGIYVGIGGNFKKGTADEIAINEDINTRKGVERIIRAAFEYAKTHGKKTRHMADKSNAMRYAHELWLRAFDEVAARVPGHRARSTSTSTRSPAARARTRRSSRSSSPTTCSATSSPTSARRSRAASAWPPRATSTRASVSHVRAGARLRAAVRRQGRSRTRSRAILTAAMMLETWASRRTPPSSRPPSRAAIHTGQATKDVAARSAPARRATTSPARSSASRAAGSRGASRSERATRVAPGLNRAGNAGKGEGPPPGRVDAGRGGGLDSPRFFG